MKGSLFGISSCRELEASTSGLITRLIVLPMSIMARKRTFGTTCSTADYQAAIAA